MDNTSYEAMCADLWAHNYLYYVDNMPVLTDQDFDAALKRLEVLEEEMGEAHPDSPTQLVGGTVQYRKELMERCHFESKEGV